MFWPARVSCAAADTRGGADRPGGGDGGRRSGRVWRVPNATWGGAPRQRVKLASQALQVVGARAEQRRDVCVTDLAAVSRVLQKQIADRRYSRRTRTLWRPSLGRGGMRRTLPLLVRDGRGWVRAVLL